jgi:hypothetical protein
MFVHPFDPNLYGLHYLTTNWSNWCFYEAGETNEEPLLQGLFYLTVLFYVFDRISNEFQLYLFCLDGKIFSMSCSWDSRIFLLEPLGMVFIQERVHMKLSFWGKTILLILPKCGTLELNLKCDSRISNEVQWYQFCLCGKRFSSSFYLSLRVCLLELLGGWCLFSNECIWSSFFGGNLILLILPNSRALELNLKCDSSCGCLSLNCLMDFWQAASVWGVRIWCATVHG